MAKAPIQPDDPLWYKDAIIYELHIKAFFDSDNTGIGDLEGLIRKLDYLQRLGITAIWLLPFYPSPLLDDGYDIADYFGVNPDYGTPADFRRLLREAHKRGIRIITELVINHTSDQHPWFQRARRARPGSVFRDFYVWSDTAEKYKDVRIIFTDFESSNWTWDREAQAYYWHRFYSHQPDLNFDNPAVQREIFRVLDYWLGMGVDGVRLDAVPYLYEREGTHCENLPETHAFLKKLRAHVDRKHPGRLLLAEANQWPEDAAQYFGDGDECHMAFHFPVMPRLFMALYMEDRFPIIDILEQSMAIPPSCQWGMFLRNHDELTLEMVTDEERDYMYKAYAQDPRARINVGIRRRLAPLLNNNRRRIELMNSLLLSLPGTPILYYGDEIGMGDNYYLGDRDGVRTPMQWSPDRNAGFSQTNSQKLYLPVIIDAEYNYMSVNVENQEQNPSSLLWFMRRLISIRKQFKAFGRGRMEFISSDNPKVLSYVRRYEENGEEEVLLIAANLSRHCQVARLELSKYADCRIEELFSRNEFPKVTGEPYTLTLSPHSFFWFTLIRERPPQGPAREPYREASIPASWDRLFQNGLDAELAKVLQGYMLRSRWFAGKGKKLRRIEYFNHTTLSTTEGKVHLLLASAVFTNAPSQLYHLPLAFATGPQMLKIRSESSSSIIAPLRLKNAEGILYEAIVSRAFQETLLGLIAEHRNKGETGLFVTRGLRFRDLLGGKALPLPSFALKVEQSNSSIVYDQTFFLKLYRRLEEGVNPDAELSAYLTERTGYRNTPAFAGSMDWKLPGKRLLNLGVLFEWVNSESDGWTYALNAVERYLNLVMLHRNGELPVRSCRASEFEVRPEEIPESMQECIGGIFMEQVALLGRRVGELHLALASLGGGRETTAEPFSLLYQKSLYQSFRSLTVRVLDELAEVRGRLPENGQEDITFLLDRKKDILQNLRRIAERKIQSLKIRIHGDLHLGQVLYTGRDFIITDFEGEPARTIGERRLKYSALRDVAGMVRSFHYAAHGTIHLRLEKQGIRGEELKGWADSWYYCMRGIFMHQYRQTVGRSTVIPQDEGDFRMLMEIFLLEKAVYEIGYELNNRPDWVEIPLRGIRNLLEEKRETEV